MDIDLAWESFIRIFNKVQEEYSSQQPRWD